MHRRALLGTLVGGVVGAAGCLSVPQPDDPLGVPASESPWGADWRAESVDRVVVDRGPAERTGVSVSREQLMLPTASATFTLRNRRLEPLQTNPYAWTLWQRDDGWRAVYPDAYLQPQTTLMPDESLAWELRIDNRGGERGSIDADEGDEKTTFAGVPPGEYAVSQEISFGETRVLCLSQFEVVD